jgi:hypothetical protein
MYLLFSQSQSKIKLIEVLIQIKGKKMKKSFICKLLFLSWFLSFCMEANANTPAFIMPITCKAAGCGSSALDWSSSGVSWGSVNFNRNSQPQPQLEFTTQMDNYSESVVSINSVTITSMYSNTNQKNEFKLNYISGTLNKNLSINSVTSSGIYKCSVENNNTPNPTLIIGE